MKTACQTFVNQIKQIAVNSSIRLHDSRDVRGEEFRDTNQFEDCVEAKDGKIVANIAGWGRFEGKPNEIVAALTKKANLRAAL